MTGLGRADFDIELDGKPLEDFTIDDMCVAVPGAVPGISESRPGSFILYFDDPELTVQGRIRAVEVARLVAPALLARGHDLLILRNGYALRLESKWTHDATEVSAALDRIASDPGNGDSSRADAEELHAERLLGQLADAMRENELQSQIAQNDAESRDAANGAARARQSQQGGMLSLPGPVKQTSTTRPGHELSKVYQTFGTTGDAAVGRLMTELQPLIQDELRRIERDIDRLRGAVRYLALRESPKGIVYFSDTLRRDPGAVVVRAMDSSAQTTRFLRDSRWRTMVSTWDAHAEFDSLVRDSSTYGVRFYAVEGRGLAAPSNWVRTSQDTIASMALETGGLSFLNGIAPPRIADGVVADQACWYLVSFPPSGWEADRTLNLGVWAKQPGLRVQTRSALVIPSRRTLTQTRLIAAHFEDPTLQARPLSVSVYPVGGTTKALQVLTQVRLPDGDMPSEGHALWDIGVDVVSGGEIVGHNSNRMAWRGGGQPPVYQSTLSLPSGPYEIVVVAYDIATDSIRAGRINGSWPPSSNDRVMLSLPALAQPQRGGVVLDGKVKASGIVVRGAGNPVDPRASVAFVTAACIEGNTDAVFRAERRIVGETEVAFTPMGLRPDGGRCVQIRDLVAARSLGPGRLTYFVRVVSGGVEVASQELAFDVADVPTP